MPARRALQGQPLDQVMARPSGRSLPCHHTHRNRKRSRSRAKAREQAPGAAPVRFPCRPESIRQLSLLDGDSRDGNAANQQQSGKAKYPVRGQHERKEHDRDECQVDRVTYEAIGSRGDQFMGVVETGATTVVHAKTAKTPVEECQYRHEQQYAKPAYRHSDRDV